MTAKNCSKCGESKLFTEFSKHKSSKDGLHSHCKKCKARDTKAWAEKNKEKIKNQVQAWHQANKEQSAIKNKARYTANREKRQATIKAWAKANPEKIRSSKAKRRAIQLQAIPPWFEKQKVELVYKKAVEWGFEVDHVYPLQGENVCGLHCWANLQLLDGPLNAGKQNRVWINE